MVPQNRVVFGGLGNENFIKGVLKKTYFIGSKVKKFRMRGDFTTILVLEIFDFKAIIGISKNQHAS